MNGRNGNSGSRKRRTAGMSLEQDIDGSNDTTESDYRATESDENSSNNIFSAAAAIDWLSRILSKERLKLSIAVRNAVEEEIHGARCRAVEETPELMEQSLKEFQNELDSVSSPKRDIYDMIVASVSEQRNDNNTINGRSRDIPINISNDISTTTQPKHYADDEEFRLRFLRCEFFEVKNAVERFLNYLNYVHELWGFKIVSQRLVVKEDFSKAELKYLRKGYFQLLPFRDRSGRRVVVISNDVSDEDPTNCLGVMMKKCLLYIMDVAGRDSVESQRKGIVVVVDRNGMTCQIKNRFPMAGITKYLPTRVVAGHYFLPDSMAYGLLQKYLLTMYKSGWMSQRFIRNGFLRSKFYNGYTKLEMKYCLMGYGVPIEYLPSTDTGKIKVKHWNAWLKTRALIESEKIGDKALGIVECPDTKDVVFRHGQSYKKVHSNNTLRNWIESTLMCRKMAASSLQNQDSGSENYRLNDIIHDSSNKNKFKTTIDQFCNRLIDDIENNQKARFLKWDNSINAWVLMYDKAEIKKKISASFYNYSKRSFGVVLGGRKNNINVNINDNDNETYKFIEGGRNTTDLCSTPRIFDTATTNGIERKRSKTEVFTKN